MIRSDQRKVCWIAVLAFASGALSLNGCGSSPSASVPVPVPGPAAPMLVQHVSISNTRGGQVRNGGDLKIPFPNGTQAGNCIIIAFQGGLGGLDTVIKVTDDKNNTYILGPHLYDSTNAQEAALFYALNVVSGTRVINLHNSSGSTVSFVSAVASEFFNVATASAVDMSNSHNTTGTSVTAGSITPTASGDLLYQYVVRDDTTLGTSSFTAGSQSNITWALLSADLQDGQAAQYGVYNSTSAINPTMTMGTSTSYISLVIALKAASAGGAAPAGIRVNRVEHISLWSSSTGGPGYSNQTTVQFPTAGNLLVASTGVGNGGSILGITDSKGNTWATCGSGAVASPHNMQVFYAAHATPDPALILMVTSANNTSDSTLMLYDVSGAATSPCDRGASASGNQTTNTSSLTGPAITPTTSNGIIFANIQQEFNTENGTSSPAGALFDAIFYTGEDLDGPLNSDQNGGWAHVYNSDTTARTFIWTFVSGTDPQRNWASYAAAFKAAN